MASLNNDWRNFGGVKRYEKNSITSFNTLVVDKFTVKEFYNGVFTVSGELFINGKTNLKNSVSIGENTDIGGNVDISGNVKIIKSVIINNNLRVGGNTDISGNVDISGTISIGGDLNLTGSIKLDKDVAIGRSVYVKDKIYIGGITDPSINIFFKTDLNNVLGLNVLNPTATFDISGKSINTLKMKTALSQNVNIISVNNSNDGITVSTDPTKNVIKFWNGVPIPFTGSSLNNDTILNVSPTSLDESSITYYRTGDIYITCPNNTFINSNVTIGKKTNGIHQMDETAVISDVTNTPYLYKYYEIPETQYKTGNALTLLSTMDNSSNIGLNLVTSTLTSSLKGISINGGTYIKDTSKSFGAISIFDVCGASIPVQITVAGNSKAYLKTTTVFNTLIIPETEKYSLWVNGPLRITNDEIQVVLDVSFEINTIINQIGEGENRCVLAGSTFLTRPNENGDDNEYPILYTNDGGKTWLNSLIVNSGNFRFTGGCVYDNSYTFLSATRNFYYFSSNSHQNWKQISTPPTTEENTTDILVLQNGNFKLLLFSDNTNTIQWFIVNEFAYMAPSTDTIAFSPPNYTDLSCSSIQSTQMGIEFITSIGGISINGGDNIIYVAGNGVQKNKINPSLNLTNLSPLITSPNGPIHNTNNVYNAMCVFRELAVFVGDGIITYDNNVSNVSATYYDKMYSNVNFQDVKINQSGHVIAVGSKGEIYYSLNGCDTWSFTIPNNYGMGNILQNRENKMTSLGIADKNSILVGSVDISHIVNPKRLGHSRVFYCHWPDLFNHENNYVADICGNMNIDGYLKIKDDAKVRGNFDVSGTVLIKGNSRINGNVILDASVNIYGVTNMNREVFVNADITVGQNYKFRAWDASFQGVISMEQTYESYDINSGAFISKGGVGIHKRLNVGGDTDISGNMHIRGNMDVSENVIIIKDLSSSSIIYTNKNATDASDYLTGGLVVKKGMGVSGSVFIEQRLRVGRYLDPEESVSISTGALAVEGGWG